MPALDWDGHSKIYNNTRLKSNRFILNHLLDFNLVFLDILLCSLSRDHIVSSEYNSRN